MKVTPFYLIASCEVCWVDACCCILFVFFLLFLHLSIIFMGLDSERVKGVR